MSNKSKIEICANSVESAVKAQQAGAYRVELCAGIPEGGTTPSFGEIRMAHQLLNQTKLHVIIRPRGGDFLYSPIELDIMLHDIKVALQLGADGLVFGCLTAEGYVDVPLMQKLMNAVGEMSVTFHRAFDMCSNPKEALEQIIGLGIDRVLTSGQEATAEKGIPLYPETFLHTFDEVHRVAYSLRDRTSFRRGIYVCQPVESFHVQCRGYLVYIIQINIPFQLDHGKRAVFFTP